tara:strand:- start:30 stop:419 length:390 start_codon:yes stop_codon:yes gene_type:complete
MLFKKETALKFKFLLAGFINTLFGYSIFSSTQFFFQNILLSLIMMYLLGLLFNYFSYSKVFDNNFSVNEFSIFFLVYLITLAINFLVLQIFLMAEINIFLSQIICIPFIVLLTYVLLKKVVFRGKKIQN